jgi:hypothetical protein
VRSINLGTMTHARASALKKFNVGLTKFGIEITVNVSYLKAVSSLSLFVTMINGTLATALVDKIVT